MLATKKNQQLKLKWYCVLTLSKVGKKSLTENPKDLQSMCEVQGTSPRFKGYLQETVWHCHLNLQRVKQRSWSTLKRTEETKIPRRMCVRSENVTHISESRRLHQNPDGELRILTLTQKSDVFLSKRQNSDTVLTFLALIPQMWFWSQIHQRLKGGLRVQSQNSKKKVGAPKMVAGVTTIMWLRVSFSTRVMHLGVEWNFSCEIFRVSVVVYNLPAKIPRERRSHTDQIKSSYPAFLGWQPVAFH